MTVQTKRPTQLRAVMAALVSGAAISRKTDFREYGYNGNNPDGEFVMLQSRICELRKAGWPILTVNNPAWPYCRYILVGAFGLEAGGDER